MSKKRKTYFLEETTIETIDKLEEKTGLKKSKIVDKAIKDYEKKILNNNQ